MKTNKELTPLEAFNRFKMLVKPNIVSDECLELKEIIETTLEENAELKLENQGLKTANRDLLEEKQALYEVLRNDRQIYREEYLRNSKIIQQNSERREVLDILKTKSIDVPYLLKAQTLDEYNNKKSRKLRVKDELTLLEYELIKQEYLKEELL